MLTITAAQLAELDALQGRRFVDEVCAHLREHFGPELAALDEAALRRQVTAAIARAESYGLASRQACSRFLNLAASYGWNFDTDPGLAWMRHLLDDTRRSADERLDAIVARCLGPSTPRLAWPPESTRDDDDGSLPSLFGEDAANDELILESVGSP